MVLPQSQSKNDSNLDQPYVVSKAWSVQFEEIVSNTGMRLDARHFNPDTALAIQDLRETGFELQPLSGLATVELRSQFTRIWAKDRAYGFPYMNATDLLSLMALGVPSGGTRYLSSVTETDVKGLIVREGTLLMTCSGTIGRVFYVPERLDGWAATHDLIRIVPHEKEMTGFLFAYLSTSEAQHQILSHTHGGQIDHVTDAQVAECLVPIPPKDQISQVNEKVMNALLSREKAIRDLTNAWRMI